MTHPGDADWWRSAVVYQVYPRSFADHDGDGIGHPRHHRPVALSRPAGIDAIWVSPWYPSPMADGGYDVSDYRDIHPDFGSLEQADTFTARATTTARVPSAVGAPPTRCRTTTRPGWSPRYERPITGIRFSRDGIDSQSFAGIGTVPPGGPDVALGRKRARAAALLRVGSAGRCVRLPRFSIVPRFSFGASLSAFGGDGRGRLVARLSAGTLRLRLTSHCRRRRSALLHEADPVIVGSRVNVSTARHWRRGGPHGARR